MTPGLRLAAARCLAWALLLSGWLALGGLGWHHLPLLAGGQVPVALWLLTTGCVMAWCGGRAVARQPLRLVLLPGLALACAAALLGLALGGGATALLGLAVAWGALMVAVSTVVRALRHGLATPGAQGEGEGEAPAPPRPARPALVGAGMAWAVVGDPLAVQPGAVAAGVLAATLALAWLLPRLGPPAQVCRAGLLDCAWPLPAPAPWRDSAAWPRQAALLAMLPMMAALAPMAAWCGSMGSLAPRTSVALHLGAMLLPAALLPLRWAPTAARWLGWLCAGLLVAAAGVEWGAGLPAALLSALLTALAWSLAWGLPMLLPTAQTGRAPLPGWQAALATATAALAMGTAVATWGPAALAGVQALLAWVAAAGVLAGVVLAGRRRAAGPRRAQRA